MRSIKLVLLFALLVMAAAQDIRSGKISNRLIFTGLMIGIVVQIIEYQIWGVYYFLRNISVPVILFYLLFQMRVLGAGDIKLFSMIGSMLTIRELLQCMFYGFLAAGAGAVLFLTADKKRWIRLRYGGGYLLNLLLTRKVRPYKPPFQEEAFSFAFSVPILFGTVWALCV